MRVLDWDWKRIVSPHALRKRNQFKWSSHQLLWYPKICLDQCNRILVKVCVKAQLTLYVTPYQTGLCPEVNIRQQIVPSQRFCFPKYKLVVNPLIETSKLNNEILNEMLKAIVLIKLKKARWLTIRPSSLRRQITCRTKWVGSEFEVTLLKSECPYWARSKFLSVR